MIRVAKYLGGLLIALAIFAFAFGARLADRSANRLVSRPAHNHSARAAELYGRLSVADLHADSLLWGRDLLERGTHGHVDVPRLIEGNVALQAFTIVTKTPLFLNIERNDDSYDMITALAILGGWPRQTWGSLTERALYQAGRLHEFAAASGGRLTIVKSRADLEAYLRRRENDRAITAGFLGIEGAQALNGDLANIDVLFDAGVRMIAPTHFFDTDIGGSAHGVKQGGLTDKGREMIRRMEAKRMLLDLAHASPRLLDDALAMVTRPVVVSHSGVKGTCDNARNLSDGHLRGIARTGGVIGIGYWDTAVCGRDGEAIARAIRYAANVAGVEHVGLGSDYDGAIPAPFDTTGLAEIVDALLAEGFSDSDIAMVMGGNTLRVLRETLPRN